MLFAVQLEGHGIADLFTAVEQRAEGHCRRPQQRAAAAALALLALGAVFIVLTVRDGRAVVTFEGYNTLSSGEDAALRHLYDADGERVPAAVIASQAEADSDLPEQAESAVRQARQNLADVQRAATAAAVLESARSTTHERNRVGAAWEAEMDNAMEPTHHHASTTHTTSTKILENGVTHTDKIHKAISAKFASLNEKEQSQDMIKEEMQALLRRKLSELQLDVQRQLRDEKEATQQRVRRQERAMHKDVQVLKKRLLHQREQMETEIVKLSTKEHHYKSEHDKDIYREQSPEVLRTASTTDKRDVRTYDADKASLHATGHAREKDLTARIKMLEADKAKEMAKIRAAETAVNNAAGPNDARAPLAPHAQKANIERGNGKKISDIEQGYFKHVLSADDAREKMAHVVVEAQARTAAEEVEAKVAKKRAREAEAEADVRTAPLMRAVHKMQTLGAISSDHAGATLPQATAGKEKTEAGALPAATVPEATYVTAPRTPAVTRTAATIVSTAASAPLQPLAPLPAVLPAVSSAPPSAAGSSGAQGTATIGGSGDGDAELQERLDRALAQRDAAQSQLDGFLLQAKNREIAVLEKELAMNQGILALRRMQVEAADDRILLPGLAQQEAAYREGEALKDGEIDASPLATGFEPVEPAAAPLRRGAVAPAQPLPAEYYAPVSLDVDSSRVPYNSAAGLEFGDRLGPQVPAQASLMGASARAEAVGSGARQQTAGANYLEGQGSAFYPQAGASGLRYGDYFEAQPETSESSVSSLQRNPSAAPVRVGLARAGTWPEHLAWSSSGMRGVPVDRVPAWSPRVKKLQERALVAGYHLVPLGQDHHEGPLAGKHAAQVMTDRSVSQAGGTVFKQHGGQQTLAAINTHVLHKRDATADLHALLSRSASKGGARGASATALAGGSNKSSKLDAQAAESLDRDDAASDDVSDVPGGMDGASLLDQMGRVFWTVGKTIFDAGGNYS